MKNYWLEIYQKNNTIAINDPLTGIAHYAVKSALLNWLEEGRYKDGKRKFACYECRQDVGEKDVYEWVNMKRGERAAACPHCQATRASLKKFIDFFEKQLANKNEN